MSTLERAVTTADIERMTDALYVFDGPPGNRKRSKFWVLLVLSAIIAGAGVMIDSTATVIGAMIVAPLMTPILGTGLALVLASGRHAVRSALLVLTGALVVIAIGFTLGLIDPLPIVAATNGQVASRVSPGIFDLLAALATGAVGAFALVRSDISDTLPGVAIAISLVPPLVVVGLTLESGAPSEARGALLLFATNVAAIVAMCTVVLLVYPVRRAAIAAGAQVGRLRGRTLVAIGAVVVLIAIPLLLGTLTVWVDEQTERRAQPVAEAWAQSADWRIASIDFSQGELDVVAIGQAPEPSLADLRSGLTAAGFGDIPANVVFVLGDVQAVPLAG